MSLSQLTRGSQDTADFEEASYKRRTDFFFGATLASPEQILLWSSERGGTGSYYQWSGAYPKVVPPGSTPASTGGISATGWVAVSGTTRPATVTSIAALRALSRGQANTVQTLGYYTPGDQGASLYRLDATDTTSTDNGGTVIVATDGTRYKLVHNGTTTLKQWGCRGNGSTSDTVAFQSAITNGTAAGIKLEMTPGDYRLTGVISLPETSVCLTGSGNASKISWAHTGHMFNSSTTGSTLANYHTFERFKIVSTVTRSNAKANAAYAFNFANGVIRSNWTDIELITDGVAGHGPYGFFSSDINSTQDTLNFNNIEINGLIGVGFNMSRGSSVWFRGGRIIGTSASEQVAVGILFNGDMGGVWIWGMDLIFCGTGIWTTTNNGLTNREIFITHGCADSCGQYGYRFDDSCYASFTGIWAASCNIANCLLGVGYSGILNIAGGTVFNGGAYGLGGFGDGLVINSALRVTLSGVHMRNNAGYGIRFPQAAQPQLLDMTGCMLTDNGNNSIGGSKVRMDGCSFLGNAAGPTIVSTTGNCRITNTTGVNDTITVATPPMAASGNPTVVGTYVPVVAYISGGTVSSIALNGAIIFASSNISIPLAPGDVITINYSVAPTWAWVRADL